jgi:hypothetical protein
MAEKALTRRRFVVTGAAALGSAAVPALARGGLAAAKTQPIYKLVRNGPTCHACLHHDLNSLFPTRKAANGNRAHVGCNCTIVEGRIDFGTYVALFGNPERIESYRADLRSGRTRAVIKNQEPVFPAG